MAKRINFIVGLKYDKKYGGYVSKVFNLPGCMSQGKTLKEVKKNTKDAISVCLTTRLKEMKEFKKAVMVSTILTDKTDNYFENYRQLYG